MTIESNPVQQSQRNESVDIVRGLAIVGVLIANFTSFTDQQVPASVLQPISSPLDNVLSGINSIFFEWKFMTLFSILFGYGFGLLISSVERKNINPNAFFIRRMFWLFLIGFIHISFWWFDVLHLYAVSGLFLLFFRKSSNQTVLIGSIFFMIVFPFLTSWVLKDNPDTFTEADGFQIYLQFKNGNLFELFKANLIGYYKLFVISLSEIHDVAETLGRFLLGYYLLRIGFFDTIENKKKLFRKILLITLPLSIAYLFIRWMMFTDRLTNVTVYWEPFIKLGIDCTSLVYALLLLLAFLSSKNNRIFMFLKTMGKMTLTNYLIISAINVIVLYGIGFGKLGEYAMHEIWLIAIACLIFEAFFSLWWLRRFRYGPAEWIWRQLTYRKILPLKK